MLSGHTTLSTFKNAHIGKAITIELVYLLLNTMRKKLYSCFNKAMILVYGKTKKPNWHPKNIIFCQKLNITLLFKSNKNIYLTVLNVIIFPFQ